MGSIANTGRLAAFQNDVFSTGLDLGRCEVLRNLGVYRANDNAAIRQGQVVCLDAAGEVILPVNGGSGTGDLRVLGVAKWNKLPGTGKAMILDESVTFAAYAAGGAQTLSRTTGVVGLSLFSGAGRTGTKFVALNAGTDYTYTAAGVVTAIAAGAPIPLATAIFASYYFDLTQNDYDFQGRNFWNTNDDATVAENRMTVIQGPSTIFTCEYIAEDTWAVGDAVHTVDNSGAGFGTDSIGMVTNRALGAGGNGAAAQVIGRCIQVPDATDPYLGYQLDVF